MIADNSPQYVAPELNRQAVHIWSVSLDLPKGVTEMLAAFLSPEESERAARFKFDKDRRAFIHARGVLRDILGHYKACSPKKICFDYGEHGKPELLGEKGPSALHFNLAHSHQMAVYALARGQAVGIDIEYMRKDFDYLGIAKRFFSADEYQAIVALAEDQRKIAFFNCWARKEALIKATGRGLFHSLDAFSVSVTPGRPAQLLHATDPFFSERAWQLVELEKWQDYAAALAVPGSQVKIKYYEWSPGKY